MHQLEMFGRGLTSKRLSSECGSVAVASQKRRVRSLEVELVEARLELGRLTYVRYLGVVEPDELEDGGHDEP